MNIPTMSRKRNAIHSRKVNVKFICDCCFICDETVEDDGIQIILGRTSYSKVTLPNKIGQLVGDNLMVVIGVSDIMCTRCATLLNQLDKLETDASILKKTLMGYIASKYQLNNNVLTETYAGTDQTEEAPSKYQEVAESSLNQSELQLHQGFRKKPHQVSLLTFNDKTNSEKSVYSCGTCNFSTIDGDAFQVHTALCLKQVNQCQQCGDTLVATESSEICTYAASCKVCDSNFVSEEKFASHMDSHIMNNNQCSECNFTSDRNTLACHILSHGIQVFHCSLCEATCNIKAEWNEHMISHQVDGRCLKCSYERCPETSGLKSEGSSLQHMSYLNSNKVTQVNSKGETISEYVESLMRLDGFDSDGSNIEFHPCPSCGLTFLNKMLFTEHMKMHTVNKHQEPADTNDIHEEVHKSAAASVSADCSIDDDLEDLFEKLHAETSNSSLVPDQACLEKSICLQNQNIASKSGSGDVVFLASLNHETNSFQTPLQSGSESEVSQMPSQVLEEVSTSDSHIGHLSIHNDVEHVPLNSFDSSLSIQEKVCDSLGSGSDKLDSVQSQTFIYITGNVNGISDCDSQGGVVLHNATINPNNGNIEILPFMINNDHSTSVLQCPPTDTGDTCFKPHYRQLNLCKIEPEQSIPQGSCASGTSSQALLCSHCSFQTSIEVVMKRHLKMHQRNFVQKCSICKRVYSSIQRFLSHLKLRHKNAGLIKCPVCSEELESSQRLETHLSEKHPTGKQNFSCRFCSLQFLTQKACTSHEEHHTEIYRFSCELCLRKCTSEEDLAYHIKWDHERVGQCRYCGKKIDKPKTLKNHELRHVQESNHHECPECKRVFKTKTGLRHHLASHTGQFKYCCDFCGRGFMSRMMLEEHRSCHTKEERYVCDVCGQKFTFQSTYWIHRKWHETPYPYKCNFCGRFFKHSSLLAVHKRKHTGERPYKCPHCPLTFPVSGTLKRHVILHTGVYPFNCASCKRGFTARHKYSSHLEKVHGIAGHKSTESESKESLIPMNNSGSSVPGSTQEWELDDEDFAGEDNTQVFGLTDLQVGNRDPLISNQITSSRVVEIVLDDAFQPVATVTLGGNESTIPEHWYD